MSLPPNYLRDRGLEAGVAEPAQMSWVDPASVFGIGGATQEAPVAGVGLPDDYVARLVALDKAMEGVRDRDVVTAAEVVEMAETFRRFLTATEPTNPLQKERTFTDE